MSTTDLSYLARSLSAITFLAADEAEAVAWAAYHASTWEVLGRETTSDIWTLLYMRREGDMTYFPFTYEWNGQEVVKRYREGKEEI